MLIFMLENLVVLILSYINSKDRLKDLVECLESLDELERYWEHGKADIFVFDNGSQLNISDEIGANFKNVSFRRIKKNLGWAGGNNYAINYLMNNEKVDWFLILSDDVVLDQKMIIPNFMNIKNELNNGILGIENYYYDTKKYMGGGYNLKWYKGEVSRKVNKNEKIVVVDRIYGSGFFSHISVFEKIGGFNENYFMYYDETEWCFIAKKFGINCYMDHRIFMLHKQGVSTSSEFKTYYRIRNGLYFMFRFLNGIKLVGFMLIVFPSIFLKAIGSSILNNDPKLLFAVLRGVRDFNSKNMGKVI